MTNFLPIKLSSDFLCINECMISSFIYIKIEMTNTSRFPSFRRYFSPSHNQQMRCAMGARKGTREGELLTHNRKMLRKKYFSLESPGLFVAYVALKWDINVLTRLMMIPAMEMRIFGPFNRRYRRSTPFQNDTKYRLI